MCQNKLVAIRLKYLGLCESIKITPNTTEYNNLTERNAKAGNASQTDFFNSIIQLKELFDVFIV